ncbi:DHBP synthase RibB-like alpha/beta domain-containing protein [Protomyces lactucae-debilis]|uniref:Threonylcarbamoyl-AMP synthase n=1 Tax=Protomyces lactucae-debilis TaxID=2754530 RepID=A0A1Y2EU94_PROLT|nr:DHBP synthase RibB-like alpha/beta domain-containing protein [Protomyces lactucae-debilis]ORY75143.1 DHBP synthase RibB-like alpha/beta domain-containing protein [Protomyces lactucae-debilis]
MKTRIVQVSASHVQFLQKRGAHPYDNPTVKLQEPTAAHVQAAADQLKLGDLVAFPTETVYGLGANATQTDAVAKIYKAKGRPSDNPLILHVASLAQLRLLCPAGWPSVYDALIDQYWPGPLTLIIPLPEGSAISPLCTAGQSTFAVRMPEHKIALALIASAGVPLAAPSANASTRPSPTSAAHVMHDLEGRVPLILDGGSAQVGLESTVVDGTCSPPVILRPGGISLEQIRKIDGWQDTRVYQKASIDASDAEVPRTPGMKYRHYSPTARVVLFETYTGDLEQRMRECIGDIPSDQVAVLRSQSWPASLSESLKCRDYELGKTLPQVSRNLFGLLRECDERDMSLVLVEGVQEANEGLAVMNRLRKAASLVISD